MQQALAEGALDAGRYESWLSLQRELRHLESRQDIRVQLAEKARMKALARHIREHYRDSGKRRLGDRRGSRTSNRAPPSRQVLGAHRSARDPSTMAFTMARPRPEWLPASLPGRKL